VKLKLFKALLFSSQSSGFVHCVVQGSYSEISQACANTILRVNEFGSAFTLTK